MKEKRQKMKGEKCKGKVESMKKIQKCVWSEGRKIKQKEHTKT